MNQHLYIKKSNSVVTWIQKNACTAINASVAAANGIIPSADKFNWMYANESHATLKQIENADYRFVFLRDPLSRLQSAFYDEKVRKVADSFVGFVDFIEREKAIRLDVHWRPQTDFLIDGYDDVFNVADMQAANKVLDKKIGFQVADIRGIYSYGTGKYPKDCRDTVKAAVAKLYAVDYLLFAGVKHGGA